MPEQEKMTLNDAAAERPKMDSVAVKKKTGPAPKKKEPAKAPVKRKPAPKKKEAVPIESRTASAAADPNEEETVKVRIVGRPRPPADVVKEALAEETAVPAPDEAPSAAPAETVPAPKPRRWPRTAAPVPEDVNAVEAKIRALSEKRTETPAEAKREGAGLIQTIDPLPADRTEIPVAKPKRSVKLYRRIALVFLALTLVLVGVVGYYTMVKVEISLVPNQERISNKFIFDVQDKESGQATGSKAVIGAVRELDVALNEAFKPSGADIIGEEVVGEVTIVNDYTQSQPLVASTRLLSADNKLFRLRSTVTVPAGGRIKAEIYADQPSAEMAVGPGRFTIPGLWAGLQDKIYAQSDDALVYQKKEKRIVKTEDIEGAVRELKEKLLSKAKTEINSGFESYDQMIYKVDEGTIAWKADAKDGDEKDEFAVDMTAKVTVVAFSSKDAVAMAKEKFLSNLAANKEVVVFDENSLIYTLESQDPKAGRAVVNSTFEGKISLKSLEGVIKPSDVVGLSEKELKAYLDSLSEVAGYEIVFTPSFLRRVPSLSDRIKIEIKK